MEEENLMGIDLDGAAMSTDKNYNTVARIKKNLFPYLINVHCLALVPEKYFTYVNIVHHFEHFETFRALKLSKHYFC